MKDKPDLLKNINIKDYKLLKYYDITLNQSDKSNKDNIFLLAGEHPRELIASEMMLNFVTFLCKNRKDKSK